MRIFCLAIIGIQLAFTACTSSGIRVYSEPSEVEVFLNQRGKTPKALGKTPLNLEERDMDWGTDEGLQLKFVKEGYKTENLVVPKTRLATETTVHALLEKDARNQACEQQGEALRRVADAVAKSQNYIYKNEYEKAQLLLESLSLSFPDLSVVYDLLGNVYYLRKDLQKSLNAYQQSDKLWPNNRDTKKMIQRLEAMLGASQGGI